MKIEQVLEVSGASEFEPWLFHLLCDLGKVNFSELWFPLLKTGDKNIYLNNRLPRELWMESRGSMDLDGNESVFILTNH